MSQERYRAWSELQEDLPLFWQPQWLDILSNIWTVEFTDVAGKLRAVWPYIPARKALFQFALWPPCTPYLGPRLLTKRVQPIKMPSQLSYVSCTFSDPAFSWIFASKARAMATQKIRLPATHYSSDLKRRLKNANGKFSIISLDAESASERLLFARNNWSIPIPLDSERIFKKAIEAGLGSVLGLYFDDSKEGQALGYIGIVWDKKTTYLLFITKHPNAPSSTSPMLVSAAIKLATQRNCSEFDFCSGYLRGVRDFFTQFGASPEWYGQLRLSKGLIMQSVEFCVSRWSTSRI